MKDFKKLLEKGVNFIELLGEDLAKVSEDVGVLSIIDGDNVIPISNISELLEYFSENIPKESEEADSKNTQEEQEEFNICDIKLPVKFDVSDITKQLVKAMGKMGYDRSGEVANKEIVKSEENPLCTPCKFTQEYQEQLPLGLNPVFKKGDIVNIIKGDYKSDLEYKVIDIFGEKSIARVVRVDDKYENALNVGTEDIEKVEDEKIKYPLVYEWNVKTPSTAISYRLGVMDCKLEICEDSICYRNFQKGYDNRVLDFSEEEVDLIKYYILKYGVDEKIEIILDSEYRLSNLYKLEEESENKLRCLREELESERTLIDTLSDEICNNLEYIANNN